MTFEEPNNISVTKKSNEENIAAIKSYLSNLSDNLNYLNTLIDNLTTRVTALESEDE